MENRLGVSKQLTKSQGSHIIAIDENEQERLGLLLGLLFPDHTRTCVTVVHNKKGIQGDYFSYTNDFLYFLIPSSLSEINGIPLPAEQWEYDNLRKWGSESTRDTAKNCFYPILVKDGTIVGYGHVCGDAFHVEKANRPIGAGIVEVYPVDTAGVERKWRYARHSVEKIQHLLKVHVTRQGEIQILKAKDKLQPKTVWDDARYIAGDYGTKLLTDHGLYPEENLYPKSIHAVVDSLRAVTNEDALVLDYYAGSGTTAHAVINLNREDGGRRKYILVEMGEHFSTVILPRVKKVVYSDKWKDGKAQPGQGISHFVKYYDLEQYEDTLRRAHYDDFAGAQRPLFAEGDPYGPYAFLRDLRLMGDTVTLDEAAGRVDVRLDDLYPGIDLAETLSCVTGKGIRRITRETVEFQDGTTAGLTEPDWNLLKPLLWW